MMSLQTSATWCLHAVAFMFSCDLCLPAAETNDGAIMFVFGDEAAVKAQKLQEEKEAPPASAEQEAPVQEPEAAYEAARAEQAADSPAGITSCFVQCMLRILAWPECNSTSAWTVYKSANHSMLLRGDCGGGATAAHSAGRGAGQWRSGP